MKKTLAMALTVIMLAILCCACSGGGGDTQQTASKLDTSEDVTLTICGAWSSSKAIEAVSQAFYEKYPNCHVEYEYLQNYEELVLTRLEKSPDSLDLFLTSNIQSDSARLPYAEELLSHSELNLADTNPALIKNFTLKNADPNATAQIYAIPLGGELRGMYVNKTLLASLGLEVPKNVTELLSACQVLKDAGYVPMNGNPGMFSQRLLYPYACNLVANAADYKATYDRVNSCETGVSELFRGPMEVMYELMSNYYYDYKYVETELNMYTDNSDEGCARYFFNVLDKGNGFEKVDDVGIVAFTSGTLTQKQTMDKIKDDYHSAIEYEFVLAPVSDEGGFAYISPATGIAVNKNSKHVDWAVEFLNFLFSKEVNTDFANVSNYIPNTTDSFGFIRQMFNVPDSQISDLGQATFDYDFYQVIEKSLVSISKGNNPKYMNTDAAGNTSLYSLDYYMEQLEAAFAGQRESGEK